MGLRDFERLADAVPWKCAGIDSDILEVGRQLSTGFKALNPS